MKKILILLILIISCNINAQEDKAYEVLNAVFEELDNKLLERLKKHSDNKYVVAETKAKLNNPIRINPVFFTFVEI